MRKEFWALLFAAAFLMGAVSTANAGQVVWTIMQDASMTGMGPGDDDLLGTADDSTSGQNNNCNLSSTANCSTAGTPGDGSWSFVALELRDDMLGSCIGGSNPGDPCTPPSGPECIGGLCNECPQVEGVPDPWDTYSYMGLFAGKPEGTGKLTACQDGTTSFTWTDIKVGASESVAAGLGGTCIRETAVSDPSSACGVNVNFTSTADIELLLGCAVSAATINNLTLDGRVYATGGGNLAANCGYTVAEINALRATALGKGGQYLLVMCGTTNIPNDATTTSPCLRGATAWDVIVAYTADNASDCTSACGGTCLFGTAEDVE